MEKAVLAMSCTRTKNRRIAFAVLASWGMLMLLFMFTRRDLITSVTTLPILKIKADDQNPIPKQNILDRMSTFELETLFHRYVSAPQTSCNSIERMGNLDDGGWDLCLDPRYAPPRKNCLAYSFGVNNDYSFDDAMEKYGCEVHSFDPSMNGIKDHLRGKKVHFHLEGIGVKPDPKKQWKLFTMQAIRERLGHVVGRRRLDVMKMDVEGAERTSLPLAFTDGSLSDVPQICFELHTFRPRFHYLQSLNLLREAYAKGLRIYMTNRNLQCQFTSRHSGIMRTGCHEIYMVNITLARE